MTRLLARTILALVGATNIYAAETATLSGIVRDPSDAAIVGAEVTIRANDTGATRRVMTNDNGLFSAPALQPGVYTITITTHGFKSIESKDVRLGVAEVRQMDFTMEIGEVSQSVVVEGNAPLINTIDGSVGMTVNHTLVENLPLNGRSFQLLVTLAPGVNLPPASKMYGDFTVNGQRSTANYLTLDGASGTSALSPLPHWEVPLSPEILLVEQTHWYRLTLLKNSGYSRAVMRRNMAALQVLKSSSALNLEQINSMGPYPSTFGTTS